jgi:hypothetical protein
MVQGVDEMVVLLCRTRWRHVHRAHTDVGLVVDGSGVVTESNPDEAFPLGRLSIRASDGHNFSQPAQPVQTETGYGAQEPGLVAVVLILVPDEGGGAAWFQVPGTGLPEPGHLPGRADMPAPDIEVLEKSVQAAVDDDRVAHTGIWLARTAQRQKRGIPRGKLLRLQQDLQHPKQRYMQAPGSVLRDHQ